jgi:hypothetical protein
VSRREFETAQNSQTEAQNMGYLGRCGVRRKTYDCQHFFVKFRNAMYAIICNYDIPLFAFANQKNSDPILMRFVRKL